jgi:uncharacterized RmlC-like cupin family protein
MHAANRTRTLTVAALALVAGAAGAGDIPKQAVKYTPSELQWKPSDRVPGLEVANIIGTGAGKNPGPYVYRVKFPAKFKMEAHGHPDERRYTILSGTWYIGWGEKFDESRLIALPAGSFYTEPARVPHFVATRDEGAMIEISGTGPTAVNYADAARAAKK